MIRNRKSSLARPVDRTAHGLSRKHLSKNDRGRNYEMDFTPLRKFLLSKVGKLWDDVHREAKSRLPEGSPLSVFVGQPETSAVWLSCPPVSTAFWSVLYVDENGILQKQPDPTLEELKKLKTCTCCTFTFNGKPI